MYIRKIPIIMSDGECNGIGDFLNSKYLEISAWMDARTKKPIKAS